MDFDMSSLVSKSKQQTTVKPDEHNFGIQSPFISGLGGTKQRLEPLHPLEASERNYDKQQFSMEMIMLKNTQGIHAPLRIAMELKAAEKIGRLPFLESSNLMRDVILGKDEDIGFEDILNTAEFREQVGQPHAIMEKHLGLL